jgi:hypothetical protein
LIYTKNLALNKFSAPDREASNTEREAISETYWQKRIKMLPGKV